MRLAFPSFALWVSLIQFAHAKECEIKYNPIDYWSAPLRSQREADLLLKGCTTVIGGLNIPPEYEGTLFISGVTNITGALYVEPGSRVTKIAWNDLKFVKSIFIDEPASLESLSFPQLSSSKGFSVRAVRPIDVDLPALITCERLGLTGNISSFNAPLLFNASIQAGDGFLKSSDDPPSPLAYNFSLPSLEYAGYFELEGHFTGISLPRLKNVTAINYLDKFKIITNPRLNITLPSLIAASDMYLNCDGSVSLPSLVHVRDFTLDSDNTTGAYNATFPALETAQDIIIYGKISDASLPKIRDIWSLKIKGGWETEINCTASTADWMRINSTWSATNNTKCSSRSINCHQYSCSWYDSRLPKGPLLTDRAKGSLAIGGVLFGLILVMGGAIWLTVRRRRKAAAMQREREREIEMDAITIVGDTEADEREVQSGVDERRDSKDTVVVGVNETGENGQRS